MISLTILAILIGLLTSLGAYLLAFWQLRKLPGLRWLVIATVIVFVCMLGAGTTAWLEGQKTEDALCTFRGSLETQVIQSEAILKANPNGVTFANHHYTPAQIQETIDNQTRAVDSLSDLQC